MKSSKWVSLIRTLMWLVIAVGVIASLTAGVVLGIESESPILAFVIMVGGILFTLLLNAAIMIFLDMADDIRAIRQKLDKM